MRNLLVLALAVTCGCQRGTPSGDKTESKPEKVTVISPKEQALLRVVEQPGVIQADEQTWLYPKLAGYVEKLHADIGKEVRKGEVLIELSIPELHEEGKEKTARLAQMKAEVTQSQKALEAALANVTAIQAKADEAKSGVNRTKAAVDRWESENKRVTGLVERGVLDAQTRDETLNQYRSAQASHDEAKARVTSALSAVIKAKADSEKAKADVVATQAKQTVAEAETRRLSELLKYATLRAPYDGIITGRDVNTGDFVRPERAHGMMSIAKMKTVRAVVQVPEADAFLVSDNLKVTLTIVRRSLQAKITRSSWALSPNSRTLRVEMDLDNAGNEWRPGMFVQARFEAPLPKAWTVPAPAIARLGDLVAVYRIEGGKAIQTPVQLGHSDGAFVEVRRWLKPGTPAVWVPFTGSERLAGKAAGLYDGHTIEE